MRRQGTAPAAPTGSARRCFRSSQSLDQLLHEAEQGEDRHCQHDVNDDTHVSPFTAKSMSPRRFDPRSTAEPLQGGPTRKLDRTTTDTADVDGFFTPQRDALTDFPGLPPTPDRLRSPPEIVAMSSTPRQDSPALRMDRVTVGAGAGIAFLVLVRSRARRRRRCRYQRSNALGDTRSTAGRRRCGADCPGARSAW